MNKTNAVKIGDTIIDRQGGQHSVTEIWPSRTYAYAGAVVLPLTGLTPHGARVWEYRRYVLRNDDAECA